jgi:hypothetical protein
MQQRAMEISPKAGSIKGDVKKKHFARAARGRYFSDIQPLLAAAA